MMTGGGIKEADDLIYTQEDFSLICAAENLFLAAAARGRARDLQFRA